MHFKIFQIPQIAIARRIVQFFSSENFTGAHLFQIALEIMW